MSELNSDQVCFRCKGTDTFIFGEDLGNQILICRECDNHRLGTQPDQEETM